MGIKKAREAHEALGCPYVGNRGFFILAKFEMNLKIEVKLDPRWRAVGAVVSQVVEIAARNVEKGGKGRIAAWPAVDTGATMNSIEAKPVGSSAIARGLMRAENMEWQIGPSTDYAPFIEFGTVFMRARPFMIPALEDERPRLIEALVQLMKRLETPGHGQQVRLV